MARKTLQEDSIKELLDGLLKNKLNSLLKITFYDKDSLRYVGITDVNSKEYIGYQATKRYLAKKIKCYIFL